MLWVAVIISLTIQLFRRKYHEQKKEQDLRKQISETSRKERNAHIYFRGGELTYHLQDKAELLTDEDIKLLLNYMFSFTRGERNREIKHVNTIIRGLQKAIAALGEWLQSIKETLTWHETISNPDDYNLGDVLLCYLELRKADREFWAHRAQTKASLKDLQAVLNAITFLRERKIDTVHALGTYLSNTGKRMNDLRRIVRSKEQRIRDIDALLAADKVMHDLQPMHDEYNSIRWKGAKERFATAHADELEQYKKAQRLLHKFSLSHPIGRHPLRTEQAQLEQEIEALRPDLDALQAELDELKTVRYWVRKVVPDALPSRTESGASSLRDAIDVSQNENELTELLERTAKQVVVPQQQDVTLEVHQQRKETR